MTKINLELQRSIEILTESHRLIEITKINIKILRSIEILTESHKLIKITKINFELQIDARPPKILPGASGSTSASAQNSLHADADVDPKQ